MARRPWLQRIDHAVLDEDSRVRVRFLVSASAAVFAVFLGLMSLVVGVLSLVRGYVLGLVVAAVLFLVTVGLLVVAGLGLLRRQ